MLGRFVDVFLSQLLYSLRIFIAVWMFVPFFEKRSHYWLKNSIAAIVFLALNIAATIIQVRIYGTATMMIVTFIVNGADFVWMIYTLKGSMLCYIYHFFSAVFVSTSISALREVFLRLRYLDLPFSYLIVPDQMLDFVVTAAIMALVYSSIYFSFLHKAYQHKDVTPNRAMFAVYFPSIIIMPMLSTSASIIVSDHTVLSILLLCTEFLFVVSMLLMQYAVFFGSYYRMQMENEGLAKAAVLRLSKETFALYNTLKDNMDNINIKCHDMKHRLINSGRLPNDKWTDELVQSIELYDRTVKTGNEQLDTVLTYHIHQCDAYGISLECVADGKQLGFMELSDMYTLFGNIISNAEEYLMTAPKETRTIHLEVKAVNSFLIIHSENFFSGALALQDGLPASTKGDKYNHGFGTLSMRMVAEKYGGAMSLKTEDGLFILDILIPIAKSA